MTHRASTWLGVHQHTVPAGQVDSGMVTMPDGPPREDLGVPNHHVPCSPSLGVAQTFVFRLGEDRGVSGIDVNCHSTAAVCKLSDVGFAARASRNRFMSQDAFWIRCQVGLRYEEPLALTNVCLVPAAQARRVSQPVRRGTDLFGLERCFGFCHRRHPGHVLGNRRYKPMSLVVPTQVPTLFVVDVEV